MGQDEQAQSTSHRSHGKKSAAFAPGLSPLALDPWPQVSCLCPSPPRLCCSCPPPLSPPRSRQCPRVTRGLWIQSPSRAACILRVPTPSPRCQPPPPPGHCTPVQHGSMPAQERSSSSPRKATVLQFTTSPASRVPTAGTSSPPSPGTTSLLLLGHSHQPSDVFQFSHLTTDLHRPPPSAPRELSEEQSMSHAFSTAHPISPFQWNVLAKISSD